MAADLMSQDAPSSRLVAHGLTVGYGGQPICADLDVRLPDGRFDVLEARTVDCVNEAYYGL